MEAASAEAASEGSEPAPAMTGDERADELLARSARELDAAAGELQAAVDRADKAEEALAAVESLIDVLLDEVERPIIVLDTELRVTGWSTGAEKCWSRAAADAVGRRWSRLGRSVDPSATSAQLDQLIGEGVPGDMVPFGDSLQARLVGEGDAVRYVVLTQAGTG